MHLSAGDAENSRRFAAWGRVYESWWGLPQQQEPLDLELELEPLEGRCQSTAAISDGWTDWTGMAVFEER